MKFQIRTIFAGIFCFFLCASAISQEPLVEFEREYHLKTYWQEYMPDVYAIDDTTFVLVGLNVNMVTLTMNIYLKWLNEEGLLLREREIFNVSNPDRFSYKMDDFYNGSTLDHEYIYVLAWSDPDDCGLSGEMVRSHHLVKVDLYDGSLVNDTTMCFNDIRVYHDINTSATEDSIYLYGSMGYLNQSPQVILTTIPKDFSNVIHQPIVTDETHILPLGIDGNSRAVAGSHYRFYDDLTKTSDIWFGDIRGDSIIQDFRMKYFDDHFLIKPFIVDTNEKAFLGLTRFATWESTIYLFNDDTLTWNFYDHFAQQLYDIDKIGDDYCIIQFSWRDFDYLKFKATVHYVDENGFPYGSIEFITPWLNFPLNGFVFNDSYYVFLDITNGDVLQAVSDGDLAIEEAQFEYTKVLKFKISD